ncbi:MAG: hypothetical protein EOP06_11375 [Proteobacteria bacterium]|nr:MAG: hypothetical protein EOP06_11375 [Pseudomonadota bacterium]
MKLGAMTSTIRAKCWGGEWSENSKEFLTTQHITFGSPKEPTDLGEVTFHIEVRDVPTIIGQIEATYWTIHNISKEGFCLYFAHPTASDGYVFIPMSNVLTFHTIAEDQVKEAKRYAIHGEECEQEEYIH